MRRSVAVSLVLTVAMAVPATASADIRFKGRTGQGGLVALRTGEDGVLKRFSVRWSAPCSDGRHFFNEITPFRPPFDSVTRDRFVDAGPIRGPIGDGLRAVSRVRITGTRVSERRWRGSFRSRTRVFRGERLIDRCHLRTRWRVVRIG
jgi:hypothetical protein